MLGNHQHAGNVPIGRPLRHTAQNLLLPRRERTFLSLLPARSSKGKLLQNALRQLPRQRRFIKRNRLQIFAPGAGI
ncbi:hypothetical protein D3C85_1857470 [compost metagenome]